MGRLSREALLGVVGDLPGGLGNAGIIYCKNLNREEIYCLLEKAYGLWLGTPKRERERLGVCKGVLAYPLLDTRNASNLLSE